MCLPIAIRQSYPMKSYDKYLSLKSKFEDLFGTTAWYSLKESTSVSEWKKYSIKSLKALKVSIEQSVKHYDSEWIGEVEDNINNGIEHIKSKNTIDEVIASLAATLLGLSFLQIGFSPKRSGTNDVSLRKDNWKLDMFRSAAYLQSIEQKESMFKHNQQKEIGAQKQRDLLYKYKRARSGLSFSEWCKENA